MMTKQQITNVCDQAISYTILGLIFLLPLYFTTFTFLTFEVNKVVFFRVVTEILLLVYVLRSIVAEEFKIYKNLAFYWPVGLILLSQFLSTIFSEHREIAWWGSYFRGDGFFTELHFLFFAWLFFQSYLRAGLSQKKVLIVASLSGLLVAVYGIMQVAGYDFLRWQLTVGDYLARANSSLGQPNYLASYLLLIIPLSYYLLASEKKFQQKIFWLVVLLIEFWALVLTYSRAAWLGLAAVLLVLALVRLYKKNKPLFAGALIACLLLSGFYLYISFVRPIQILPDNSNLTLSYRFKTLLNAYQGSNILRLYYYDDARQIIASAPWLGHGLDTQAFYFYNYYRPNYALYEALYIFPDRAHNQFLDILITEGWLGLLAWLSLFFAIVWYGRKFFTAQAQASEGLLVKCLLVALAACWLSLMFGFFNITVSVYFWLLIGWLFALTTQPNRPFIIWPVRLRFRLGYLLAVSLAVFVLYFSWQENIKLVVADYYYRQSKIDQFRHDYNQMIVDLNQVNKFAPSVALDNFYPTQVIVDSLPILQELAGPEDRKNILTYLVENSSGRNPANFGFYDKLYANILLAEVGRNKLEFGAPITQISEFNQAELGFSRLAKEAPGFASIFFHWGNLYFNQGKFEQATEKYNQALKLYPDLTSPDLNQEHYNLIVEDQVAVLHQLAETKLAEKKYQQALVICQQARRLRPADSSLSKQAARIYFYLGQSAEAQAILLHQIVLQPYADDNYYQLAMLARALGQGKQAEAYINQAIKLNNLPSYQEFLITLGQKKLAPINYLTSDFIK